MNDVTMVRPGMLQPRTLGEAIEFAKLIAQSSMVPPQYKGRPADVLLAVQLGAELGLAPLQSLQNVACINGKPSIYGDAAIALVRRSPVCEDIIERFEGDGEGLTAVCEARRKGSEPVVVRFSIADAKKAGLWGKQGPWQTYPKRMLQMRARGFALRDAFADVLRGLITAEEAQDYPTDVTPPADTKAQLDNFATDLPRLPEAMEPIEEETALEADDEFLASAKFMAAKGTEEFRLWWKSVTANNRALLKPHLQELQAIAREGDESASARFPEAADAGADYEP